MAGTANKVTKDLTTGEGILSFPRVFASTAGKSDKGETVYDVQFLIPKNQREDLRAILRAVKEVGEAKWGDKWKQVRTPLRDGDEEKDELTEDGSTKGEKYPERLGHYFLNARSTKPVGVVDRQRVPIVEPSEIYAGVKAKINVSFYPYSSNGNHGVGCGLNGVQKIANGEQIGSGGKPSVESMFDMLEDADDEDLGLDDLDSETEKKADKPKKSKADKAKKSKKKSSDEDDLYADLDDSDL